MGIEPCCSSLSWQPVLVVRKPGLLSSFLLGERQTQGPGCWAGIGIVCPSENGMNSLLGSHSLAERSVQTCVVACKLP
jgi:hypothetical protein